MGPIQTHMAGRPASASQARQAHEPGRDSTQFTQHSGFPRTRRLHVRVPTLPLGSVQAQARQPWPGTWRATGRPDAPAPWLPEPFTRNATPCSPIRTHCSSCSQCEPALLQSTLGAGAAVSAAPPPSSRPDRGPCFVCSFSTWASAWLTSSRKTRNPRCRLPP